MKYNGDLYYYITNLQGDVMSIVDAQGEVVAEYEYDPYGNIVSQSGPLAEVNPLRYRGYVFDSETALYYLQSRYYDPNLGRFINADAYASTGQGVLGFNMFAYCNNNPINYKDYMGMRSLPCCVCIQDCGGAPVENDDSIYELLEALFGAGYTSENQQTIESELMPFLLDWIISVKYGMTTTTTSVSIGNSDAFLSVYAVGREDNIWLSSAGAKISLNGSAFIFNLAVDNIGFSFTETVDGVEYAGTIIIDLTQFKAGIEGSITSPVPGAPNSSHTEYVNVSISGYAVFALLLYAFSGQYTGTITPAPTPIPIPIQ